MGSRSHVARARSRASARDQAMMLSSSDQATESGRCREEDNVVNQLVVRRMLLEKHGYDVVVVVTGREAVTAVERERFDLVLMDVQMPVMGGFEATGVIRAREAQHGGHMPIIAMTAHAMRGDRERCLEAGMDDYLCKPVDPKSLLACVGRLTGEASSSLANAPQAQVA